MDNLDDDLWQQMINIIKLTTVKTYFLHVIFDWLEADGDYCVRNSRSANLPPETLESIWTWTPNTNWAFKLILTAQAMNLPRHWLWVRTRKKGIARIRHRDPEDLFKYIMEVYEEYAKKEATIFCHILSRKRRRIDELNRTTLDCLRSALQFYSNFTHD